MAVDTERKRWSMLQWSSGGRTAVIFNPDTSGIDAGERATVLKKYGGIAFDDTIPKTVVVGGTVTATEADVVAGNLTITITIVGDTWIESNNRLGDCWAVGVWADGVWSTGVWELSSGFEGQRQAILDGITSAQGESTGWNTEVRDKEIVGSVVRASDAVVTVTFSAAAAYNISADEEITVTVPAAALASSLSAIVGSPTIAVSAIVARRSGGHRRRIVTRAQYPRTVMVGGVRHYVRSAEEERKLLQAHETRIEIETLQLALENAPAAQIKAARVKLVRAQRRIESLDDAEQQRLEQLREEDEIILLTYH